MYSITSVSAVNGQPCGFASRPRPGDVRLADAGAQELGAHQHQTLVFNSARVVELVVTGNVDGHITSARLGAEVFSLQNIRSVRSPIYEPATDSIFFVANEHAILQLDSSGVGSLTAGNLYHPRTPNSVSDGIRGEARFQQITALAPDGDGKLYVADGDIVRVLDAFSGCVTTLPGLQAPGPAGCRWTALAYDMYEDVLWAATETAIWRVDILQLRDAIEGDSPCFATGVIALASVIDVYGRCTAARLMAGDCHVRGFADGLGRRARFRGILNILLPSAGGGGGGVGASGSGCSSTGSGGGCSSRCLFILDDTNLRALNLSSGYVSTECIGVVPLTSVFSCIGALPSGDLLVGYCARSPDAPERCGASILSGGLLARPGAPAQGSSVSWTQRAAPAAAAARCRSQRQPSAALAGLHKALLEGLPTAQQSTDGSRQDGHGGGGGGGGGGTVDGGGGGGAASVVIVHVNGARFPAHPAVLAAHSEYFKQLLAPGGGFADSGAADVTLRDADPAAFSWLLSYMYTNELYVPDELLKPALQLADRLLMPTACKHQLERLVLGAVTPVSAVSDLIWAEQYGMRTLVEHIKAYLLRHRRQVDFHSVGDLMAKCPELAASLWRDLGTAL